MSQENAILEYLLAGNSITPLEALQKFQCFRLSGRIYDLCQRGFPINTTMIKVGNKRVASYRYAKPEQLELI